ncbi:MAG: PSD1 and planctomycete cytochrome C domain-containing protein, partial [Pirellulaceae bacterium]
MDLTHRAAAQAGGDSGPALIPGNLEESLLWQRIRAGEMPPNQPLPEAQQRTLQDWITRGAPWSGPPLDPWRYSSEARAGYDWWSLQPLRTTPLPPLHHVAWAQNAIDHFVGAKLEARHLAPSPAAEPSVLIRRLYFDLLGLPPSPAAIAEFVDDSNPQAYERLVDRVLASPQYGERWARHWLDVVRFGESQGFERDKLRTNSWRYRDWVIQALNDDLSYREFARWQLAGDVIHPDRAECVIATGCLVAGPYDEVGQSQQSQAMRFVVRQDELEDLLGTVCQTFLGLTVNCARCHDHKFDPIHQTEYYALAAAVSGIRHGERVVSLDAAPRTAAQTSVDARVRLLSDRIAAIEAYARDRVSVKPHEQGERDAGASKQVISERQAAAEKALVDALSPQDRMLRANWQAEVDHLRQLAARWADTKVYANTPQMPVPVRILHRGNPNQPGDVALPGGIAAIRGVTAPAPLTADSTDSERRQMLAEWIAHENNPLFSRVLVNRLWHYHFGVGLVETPNDFGFNGGRPSHPELLDWLALDFVRSGWSIKRLHRTILTSATYRQASRLRPEMSREDAANRWLWRHTPMRLEAEVIRDTLLDLAGELVTEPGGPGYYDFTTHTRNAQFYDMRDLEGASFQRRSIYRTWVRSGRSPFLDVFDCPDPSTKSPQRAVTTTPLQALALLHTSFVLRMADRFASRVEREAGPDVEQQVRHTSRHA